MGGSIGIERVSDLVVEVSYSANATVERGKDLKISFGVDAEFPRKGPVTKSGHGSNACFRRQCPDEMNVMKWVDFIGRINRGGGTLCLQEYREPSRRFRLFRIGERSLPI